MSPEQQSSSFREFVSTNKGVVAFVLIAFVALVAACVFGILWLLSLREDGVVANSTPTPFPGSPESSPGNCETVVVGISDSDTITTSLDVPISMSLGGRDIAVRTQAIPPDGVWTPAVTEEDTAVWVCGAIVNYILGLPDSEENRAVLEQLAPGDEMVLTTRNGNSYAFSFNSRETIAADNQDVFAQNTPGLTLVLLGSEGQERLVVNGRYVVGETSGSDQDAIVELGETTQLDDVQITVTGATYMPDRPEAPPGFAFYMVDYQIQNMGLTALDTNGLQLLLIDELGNQYALNLLASQLGNYPPLSGFLNASQMVQATAGYQVPVGLVSATLNWMVSRSDTGSRVRVSIPFNERGSAAQGTDISMYRAEVSPDFTSLLLGGQVTNVGEQQIVVVEGDVSLRTDDGAVYLLLATNPPFPWTVMPGETVQFLVTFQRPIAADAAVFTVLNQDFQLSGLR